MSDKEDRPPIRSRLAIVLMKGGLAFGIVWMLALLAFVARSAMTLL